MYYLTLTYDDNWLREGQYAELLRYGPDAQRWVTTDSIGGQVSAVTHYHGDFEMRSTSTGGVSMYHYLGNGLLCVTIANSQPLYYYMMTDNVGSVVHVVNGEGISEFDAWYDAWGRQTLAANGIGFFRGYGGHEMLPQFRLVNMDGRMYDYVLGRFLSPDNYVQEQENSQSFNRYSYCLNNPLKYTDPTGELFGIDDIIIGATAFLSSYIANGISSHDWGWKSVQSGLMSAGMSLIGLHTGMMQGSVWGTAAKVATNNVINTFMPTTNLPINSHFSINCSPFLNYGTDGFTCGMSYLFNYTNGDFDASFGFGGSNGYWGWNTYVRNHNFGIGFGKTKYAEKSFNGNTLGEQSIGTISLSWGKAAFRISNDLWGDREDRWRTTAAELSIGKFSIGTYVYTNHGEKESNYQADKNIKAPLWGKNKSGAWNNGKVFSAPFWIGAIQDGILYRVGYSHPVVQNLTQNFVHKYISPTPYFLNYDDFRTVYIHITGIIIIYLYGNN